MKTRRLMTALAAILLAAGCAYYQQDHIDRHLQPGEKAPPFSTETLGGEPLTSETILGGRTALLLFDFTCGKCLYQLKQMQRAYGLVPDGKGVYAICRREHEPDRLKDYLAENGITMPVACKECEQVYSAFDRHSATGVPQLYIIDSDGTVLEYHGYDEPLSGEAIAAIIKP